LIFSLLQLPLAALYLVVNDLRGLLGNGFEDVLILQPWPHGDEQGGQIHEQKIVDDGSNPGESQETQAYDDHELEKYKF